MRILSGAAIESMQAQETDETWLAFLDLELSPTNTLRVVNNWEAVTRNGNVYQPYRFDVGLPNEADEGLNTISLRIDNISSVILASALERTSPIPVTLSVAMASDPDDDVIPPIALKIADLQWNDHDISSDMTVDSKTLEVYPGYRVIPSTHPACF